MSQATIKNVGPYSAGLGKTEANYASLSPISFLPKAAGELSGDFGRKISGIIAGSAPPASVIEGMERIGFDITRISYVEVEDVLHRHPAVDSVAVVAKPDPKWGEVPCAFIDLMPHATATEAEIRQFCREQMAGCKVPKLVVFGPIPKT